MNQWNEIYREQGRQYQHYDIHKPHEDIVRVADFFKEQGVQTILDLGCGVGRNLIPLAEKDFLMSGIDLSDEGINQLDNTLNSAEIEANLAIGNIFEGLPYCDSFFDAVISIQVMQHGTIKQVKRGIAEIERVVRPDGYIFITLSGRYSEGKLRLFLVKTAKEIEDRVYIPTQGSETGLPHFIYNKELILKHYHKFTILDFWKDSKDYYCFLGQKKDNA